MHHTVEVDNLAERNFPYLDTALRNGELFSLSHTPCRHVRSEIYFGILATKRGKVYEHLPGHTPDTVAATSLCKVMEPGQSASPIRRLRTRADILSASFEKKSHPKAPMSSGERKGNMMKGMGSQPMGNPVLATKDVASSSAVEQTRGSNGERSSYSSFNQRIN